MKSGSLCIIALALALSSLPAVASAQVLTLEDVRAAAAEHHPSILATLEQVEAARGDLTSARGGFDPVLGAEGKGRQGGYYTLGRADVELRQATPLWGSEFWVGYRYGRGLDDRFPTYYDDETGDAGEVRGGLKVPLLKDGAWDKRRAAMAVGEAKVVSAEGKAEQTRLKIVAGATDAYMDWTAAHQNLRVADELLELARVRLEWVEAQVAAGAIPPVEKLEAQRSVLSREKIRTKAQRAVEKTGFKLSLYARDEAGQPLDLSTLNPPTGLTLPAAMTTSDALTEKVLACHPALESARAKVEAARAKERLADVSVLPKLDLKAQVSRDLGEVEKELDGTVWETGVVFSFPLLNRDARGRQTAAEAEVIAAQMELRLQEQTLRLELQDAQSAFAAASETYDISTQLLANSRKLAEAERKRFRQGSNTLFIVNLRERAIGAATLDVVDAARTTWGAWAALDALTACTRGNGEPVTRRSPALDLDLRARATIR